MSLQFEVTEQIHATPVSRVYEAVSPGQGRYLVEVLEGAACGPWLQAFEEDVAAMAALRHPLLLAPVEIGAMPDGTPVIVSERPEGSTLARWLEGGRVAPTGAALELLAGIAEALCAAHEVGVSHGDLRPEEVWLVPSAESAVGVPRVRGFGHRWLRSAVAYGGAPVMVPASRERVMPAARREIAADIAGLAALADRLLTPLQQGPRLAAAICAGQLAGEDRFYSPAAFVAALEAALSPADEEVTSPSARAPDAHRRAVGRVLASAGVTVMAAAALHVMLSREPAPPLVEAVPSRPARVAAAAPPLIFPQAATVALELASRPMLAPVGLADAGLPRAAKAAPRARQPRLWRVWSDAANGVVLVDDDGRPAQP
jgi:hypothetical protein